MKCPFCTFSNEDGALFCEQCKSDLGVAEPVAVGQPAAAQQAGSSELSPGGDGSAETIPLAPHSETVFPLAAIAIEEVITTESVAIAEVSGLSLVENETLANHIVPIAEVAPPATPQFAPSQETASEPITASAMAEAPGSDGVQAAAPAEQDRLPADAKPKLVVLRGQRVNAEYLLYEGDNYIGRSDDKAVDVDLEDQEPPDRIWSSRQHALITLEDGKLAIEDLNSTNGTFVNRLRLHPGQKRPLLLNDVIQIGTVQMKVKV